MKIYLAAQYAWKDQLREYRTQAEEAGFDVTSRWLDEPHAANTGPKEIQEDAKKYATLDLEDIDNSDVMVFFSVPETQPTLRGGRHVEFGYALARNIPIIVVGPRENIFHYLPPLRHVSAWADALTWLKAIRSAL